MNAIVLKTGMFLLLICIGYILKRKGIVQKKNVHILEKIIVNLTLPCVFLSSSVGLSMDMMLLVYMFISFVANFLLMGLSYLTARHEEPLIKGTYMIACSGYDVGNFVLPYVQAFFPAVGVMYLVSFNIANTMMAMGITYSIAYALVYKEVHFQLSSFLKTLFSSVSFDVYMFILILACLHLSLPSSIVEITSAIGSINPILVMIMFGIKLEFHMSFHEYKHLCSIISIRFIGALILSFITLLLPIDPIAKSVFVLTYFGPLVSISSIYAKRLGYQGDGVADANSLSILLSMFIMTFLLLFL